MKYRCIYLIYLTENGIMLCYEKSLNTQGSQFNMKENGCFKGRGETQGWIKHWNDKRDSNCVQWRKLKVYF